MTREELILKAKKAKSAEELLSLAKENCMELNEESAKAYFEQLHKTGEVSDDELDNVSGGGCKTSDGHTIVTCLTDCFTGEFVQVCKDDLKPGSLEETWHNSAFMLYGETQVCGKCVHLGFKHGIGYCTRKKV